MSTELHGDTPRQTLELTKRYYIQIHSVVYLMKVTIVRRQYVFLTSDDNVNKLMPPPSVQRRMAHSVQF